MWSSVRAPIFIQLGVNERCNPQLAKSGGCPTAESKAESLSQRSCVCCDVLPYRVDLVSIVHGSETLRWRPRKAEFNDLPVDRAWSADGVGASIDIALREYIHVENPLASRSPFRLAADRLTGEAHVLFDRDFADYVVLKCSGVRRPYIKKFKVRLGDGDVLAPLDTLGYDPNFVPLEISNVAGPPCSLVGSVADECDISYLPDYVPSNGPRTEPEEEDWLVQALTVSMETDNATDLELLQSHAQKTE